MKSKELSDEDSPSSEDQLDDTSDSEPEEDIDVKVCDICGDAGIEELLAVCSRCSDGAEHTYCMQTKLKQLPEGDWLCEECKSKDKNENCKDNKMDIDTKVERVEAENLNKTKKKDITDNDPDYAPESDATEVIYSEEKKTSSMPQSTSEVDLKTCEKALESSGVPSRKADVKNKSLLSHGDSFSCLGADKNKLVQPAGDLSAKNSTLSRSQTFAGPNSSKILDPLQSARATLLKSSSFKDSKTKPKKVQFIEEIPHKKNTGRECSDGRRGQLKRFPESASSKGARSSSFKADTAKTQIINPPQAESKKERISPDKKSVIPPTGSKITDTNTGPWDRDYSGHPTQYGLADKFPRTAHRSLADRNVKDRLNRTVTTKDAPDALTSKSNVPKDVRHNNLHEKSSIPSKDIGSSSILQRTTNKHVVARTFDVSARPVQVEAPCAARENNSKPLPEEKPSAIPVPSEALKSSAAPELEFIWKGQFEVLKSGKLLRSCEGIQAHLSSFASRKVLQTASRIPLKIQLEEVAYVNSWPWQYQGRSPKENNIALFFFANDIESYEKKYSKLLEHMIKYDLALKGDIAGFELLVFPSNKLPPNSQRWNRLFFLWGVFRVKRSVLSEFPNQLNEESSKTNQKLETSISDLPSNTPEISVSEELKCNETSNSVKNMHETELKKIQPVISEDVQTSSSGTQMNSVVSSGITKNNPCMALQSVSKDCQSNANSKSNALPRQKDNMEDKNKLIEKEDKLDTMPIMKRSQIPLLDLNENIDFSLADDARECKKPKHEECQEDITSSSSLSSNVRPYSFLKGRHDIEVIHIDDDEDDTVPGDAPNLELELGLKKPENKLSNFTIFDSKEASIDLNLAFHGPKDTL